MVTGKYRVGQIIEAPAAFLALIELPTVLLVVSPPLYDVLALAVSTLNIRSHLSRLTASSQRSSSIKFWIRNSMSALTIYRRPLLMHRLFYGSRPQNPY